MKKYKNRAWLEEQFTNEKRSISEIAKEFNLTEQAIKRWLIRYGILETPYSVSSVCEECGKEFFHERSTDMKFCSHECYSESMKRFSETKCENCGEIFKHQRSDDRIYCSNDCKFEDAKNRIQSTCPVCGEKFEHIPSQNRVYCSKECFRSAFAEMVSGKGNPAYKDGSSLNGEKWRGSHWNKIRQKVYERDDWTCQNCGVTCLNKEFGSKNDPQRIIQCHHIQGFETPAESNEMSNLITLCLSCHGAIEKGKESLEIPLDIFL